ncbi:MAG: hypothetical protein EAZ95_18105 [Bacteroidetes bacterium]|nr:MAG: hypothetical protein EAZ95_18105 [Bacteroidota bacterium]
MVKLAYLCAMQIWLFFHFAIELVFGILFLVSPSSIPLSFFQDLSPAGLYVARMYGFCAIAMAVLGFQAWRAYPDRQALLVSLPTLAVFHIGIAIAQIINPMNSSEPYMAGVMHSVLGFAFGVYYFKER